MELRFTDMYVFHNNLLSFDHFGEFRDDLLDLRFLSLNSVSGFLDDFSHSSFSLRLGLLFGLRDGLLHGFFDEVSGGLLNFGYSLGCGLLENFSLRNGSFSLGLLFLNSNLVVSFKVRDFLLVGSLDSSKRCFASSGGRSNGELSSFLRSFFGLNEFSDNLNKLFNLTLSLVSELFNTGVLAFHGGNHRLQLLLDKLCFDVTNFLSLGMDVKSFTHLSVLCIDDRQSLLELVLVDLNLGEMSVDDLHGMLTSSRESHNVIPML